MFKCLGEPTRLEIFEILRSCCSDVVISEDGQVRSLGGPSVGDVCCRLTGTAHVSSTISFHLAKLRNAGLVTMERRGRQIICSLNQTMVAKLAAFFGSAAPATIHTREAPSE